MDKDSSDIPETTEFHAAIGAAIQRWTRVEMSLYLIFMELIRPPKRRQAAFSAAFHSIINFNSKLQMVDAAAAFSLEYRKDQKEWNAIVNSLGRLAKRRNALAHLTLWYDARRSPPNFLASAVLDFRDGIEHPKPRFTLPRVLAASRSFGRIDERLSSLYFRMKKRRARKRTKHP